ncbi:50S ribosomal protein L15 [Rhodothermus marinus]|jgi:large subunit ribosomal protein L15|uniref:Large ribosomal subunit protein uL15 n=1 Tax=Rhodothermus marinus (strain ATCC 43812 / DSM 4252 / R-10) TaxID=518766 RepID=D0MGX3_RHOM4|nr:50S ribosomal protein L15 [Rhodothermus marinus]ACY47758.1 ribosomal protein L15 [Rhodothermus marinus DSM 4252]AEN73924.1 ribosomal protein L15 [Rhodothermus marinus SG0.5JP17-172]MBO2492476.1 50S ribosomal protein L15 [Rhodothermus marinus]BBM69048.1 50S ribosomal protein L15 [Rhodothermus marinus]BBM72026.1 50S ribosomal protein L15 [Rhodothermus marinus]
MDLSRLKPAKGAVRERKRLGRGVGSGYGGHSSTRGTKGQKARTGQKIPAYFEGGQMPLVRRVPKRGFRNPFRTEYRVINVGDLARWIEAGRLSAEAPITPETLVAAGLARKRDRIKILGDGELSVALQISAHAFSASARQKIEAAGGTATVIA